MTERLLGGVCALAVLTHSSAFAQQPPPNGKPAAVVNGEVIPLVELEAILKSRAGVVANPTAEERREMQHEALEMLIDDLVLQQFMRKNGPAVPPSVVNKKFQELLAALKAEGQTLEGYCRESGQTEARIRQGITAMLQQTAYLATHVSDAAVHKFYEDNRDFFDMNTVRARHIMLRASTAAEVEPARAKLKAVREEIISGKLTFAEAAKRYSVSPNSQQGGDLGFFPRKGALDEGFSRVAFSLKPGEVSDVVQTDNCLHLIQVTAQKPGPKADFAKIAEAVRTFAGEELLQKILADERAAARIEIKLVDDSEAPKPARRSRFGLH